MLPQTQAGPGRAWRDDTRSTKLSPSLMRIAAILLVAVIPVLFLGTKDLPIAARVGFSMSVALAFLPFVPSSFPPSSSLLSIRKPYKLPFTSNKPGVYSSKSSKLVSRISLIPSVSGIWDAVTGGDSAREALIAIRRGMILFRQGDVRGSMAEFDKAIEIDPRQKAYLWQRGLSLYYLNRFEEGAEQFRFDVRQNPNDTEESIWCYLCEVPLYGVNEARKRFLEVGKDPRSVMQDVCDMFKVGGDPEKLVAAFSKKVEEYFYATLYAGLYYESENQAEASKRCLLAACQCLYAQRSDDYMVSVAKVHCLVRNWCSHQE